VIDTNGNIFIADTHNSVIREVSASTGNITTIAGDGTSGYSGDGGPATSAQLYDPYGIFVDGAGNIFIADTDNAAVREVVAGVIQTVAGNGTLCPDPTTLCGDGGPAIGAQGAELGLPGGVFVDSGNIYIADTDDSRIRVVNTGTVAVTIAGVAIAPNAIQTVAGAYYDAEDGEACLHAGDGGPATSANLCAPTAVFVEGSNIYIADWGNSVIREVTGSTIATVAGQDYVFGYSGDGGLATSAELDYPNGTFVDGAGDILIADTLNYVIREVTAGDIQTTIGNNFLGYSGDGEGALNAELNYPGGVFVDGSGNIFIADTVSSVVREVVAASGDIQTVAGSGTTCSPSTALCGDGGAAISAQLNNPFGTFIDLSGNIFIADTEDNRVRVVNTGTAAITVAGVPIQPGYVATVAGTGTYGYSGDSGAATSAELFNPYSVFVDSTENIYIADKNNHAIREVAATTGTITTVAGNGTKCNQTNAACGDGGAATAAELSFPEGVFVDSSGIIYIADGGDNRIRAVNPGTQAVTIAGIAIAPGTIATIAGTGQPGYSGDGAAATSAQLASPSSVFVDASGNIFITDTANFVVRQVVPATGFIATVAGNNTKGFTGDGGDSTSAELNTPSSVFGDSAGNLFLADTDNSRIRKLVVTVTPPTATQPPAQTTSPGGTATYSIALNANSGNPKYAITLSCLQSSLPTNATCSFSPATITPGPLPVPFKLSITVPTASASSEKPNRIRLQLCFAVLPLAGLSFAFIGSRSKRQRWMLLAGLCLVLILLSACGGTGSNSVTVSNPTTYTVVVQGTTAAQPTPVTITTAVLKVQ
jgi:hypothetical protein